MDVLVTGPVAVGDLLYALAPLYQVVARAPGSSAAPSPADDDNDTPSSDDDASDSDDEPAAAEPAPPAACDPAPASVLLGQVHAISAATARPPGAGALACLRGRNGVVGSSPHPRACVGATAEVAVQAHVWLGGAALRLGGRATLAVAGGAPPA